jgi:hypothetical protein
MKLISLRGPKLKYCALRNYPTPDYPRIGERLDFDLNDSRTWPFASPIAAALAACLTLSPMTAEAGGKHAHHQANDKKALTHNPFSKRSVELQFQSGKGGPAILPQEMALAAIERGFRKGGLTLKPHARYNKGGVQADLDGYNPEHKIGFEWVAGSEDSIDPKESEILERDARLGKRHIIKIYAHDKRFRTRPIRDPAAEKRASKALTKAVEDYLRYLQSVGAWRPHNNNS